ncbi:DUF302 domain-containing protein [Acuticoccus sediminis]|uniref:DUF302 domain-containing protein n=1 Tax=Acuticoccus sediminis TaxID=2184697 RepID=A0A8B2NKN2_9HYPH|nr:DUF302 domain-containing protein [Acuticoccus sediminis]RAI00066.1 DUF302 domain-containing protein [Acuticoccus sediminis]
MKRWLASMFIAAIPAVASAEGVKMYTFDGSFEDATFAIENEIIGHGLVVDYVSHVGAMLSRTKDDVGGAKDLFDNADVFLFCSAVLSRKMMEVDPANIAFCPYGVFVTDTDSTVAIGYRLMPDGPMKEVEALLDEIARAAAGL